MLGEATHVMCFLQTWLMHMRNRMLKRLKINKGGGLRGFRVFKTWSQNRGVTNLFLGLLH
jgi:hypothetical protein